MSAQEKEVYREVILDCVLSRPCLNAVPHMLDTSDTIVNMLQIDGEQRHTLPSRLDTNW